MYIDQVLPHGYKGAGDEVNSVLDAEQNVRLVLLGQVSLVDHLPREAHALAVGKGSAALDHGFDLLSFDTQDAETQQAVVHQDLISCRHILVELRIADTDPLIRSYDLLRRKGEQISFFQFDASVLKGTDTIFGAFGVEHDRDGQVHVTANLADRLDPSQMLVMRPVGKIKSCHIHACTAQSAQHLFGFTGRSDGTYDLGFSHIRLLSAGSLRKLTVKKHFGVAVRYRLYLL